MYLQRTFILMRLTIIMTYSIADENAKYRSKYVIISYNKISIVILLIRTCAVP